MAPPEEDSSPLRLILSILVAAAAALVVALLFWMDDGDDSSELPEAKIAGAASGPGQPGPATPERGVQTMLSPVPSLNGRAGGESSRERGASSVDAEDGAQPNVSQALDQSGGGEVDEVVRDEMRAIADSGRSHDQKVARFKSYLSGDHEGPTQTLAVRHLSKLIGDDDYNKLLAPELMDPDQSEPVRAALIRDINGRNRQVMLPVMAEIVNQPDHPLEKLAHETLGRYLGDRYTSDPEDLRAAVGEYIRRSNDDL